MVHEAGQVVARRGVSGRPRESVSDLVAKRARKAYERFNERKAEILVLYGSTFLVVHELLGIASYAITYSLLSTGVLDVEHFAGIVGFTEEDGTSPPRPWRVHNLNPVLTHAHTHTR
jgi:hypothetical protein